jgi:hypothetical protein
VETPIETAMYGVSQLFLVPVLLAVAVLFGYAFFALGAFAWQARQRRRGAAPGFELRAAPTRGSRWPNWKRSPSSGWNSPASPPGWRPCSGWWRP